MQITINTKPLQLNSDVIGRKFSRADIDHQIADYKWRRRFDDVTVAYNMQKWRRKSTGLLKKKKIDGKMQHVMVHVAVRDKTYWTANVYIFDNAVLKVAGLKVIQYRRNFRLVRAK